MDFCQPCNNDGPLIKNITGVQFGIMGPDEILNNSVIEVTKYETFDKDVPIIKGLFDIRMGTTDMNKICGTCEQNSINCPGHFGHMVAIDSEDLGHLPGRFLVL